MHEITEFFVTNITNIISTYGYLAVFLIMTAESALVPIPSEITMPFAGFLAGMGVMNFWVAVLLGAIGNVVGSLLAYWLGEKMGEGWIRIMIKKWGKWLLIHEKDFDMSLNWFKKYGQGVTFTSRLLPIVRTFISLPAGIAKMNLPLFTVLTFIGSFIWSLLLAYMGLKLGQNWMSIEPYFRKFQFIIIGLFLLGGTWYVYRHFTRKD
ncbi:MAG: DedA family protein [Microgenomates group bacterium]